MSKILSGQTRWQPSEYRLREMAWDDAQKAKFSCAFCGWAFEGAVGEAKQEALAHREKKHPETIGLPRRRRKGGQLLSFRHAAMDSHAIDEIKTERKRRAFLNGVEIVD